MRLVLALFLTLTTVSTVRAEDHVQLLKGSSESLERQNREADRANFVRLDNKTLATYQQKKILIRLTDTRTVKIDRRLPANNRWCLPHTAAYVQKLGDDFFARWGKPLQINSAVRTKEYQGWLRTRNNNAAPVSGPKASPHLTGSTIDIAKLSLTAEQKLWLARRLADDERKGLIDATEEHYQAVFHVMVFNPPRT